MKKLFISLALALITLTAGAQGPQVKTTCGVLEGVYQSGIKVFKGVPFAQPPVGELRWKAPQPVKPWSGVRPAKDFGPNPMQQPLFGDMMFGTKKMSEDCLYLNIWTPAKTMDEKLPVLVYFYGGGLLGGSGSEPRYAGESMAHHGIVSITVNYRLGVFGFLAHPELSKETSYKGSGNYGFMDQAAALQWIKDNIAAFGGDPERVTIVGESAGSTSVCALMASPVSKGLFAQAMGSSASILNYYDMPTLKEAEKRGTDVMKAVGCKSLAEMRALPAEQLMNTAPGTDMQRMYNIDGYFFTEQPRITFENGRQAHVPLLIGGNNAECPIQAYMGKHPITRLGLIESISDRFGKDTEAMVDAYGIKTDADVSGERGLWLGSDLFVAYGTWKWATMHEKTGQSPVYRYLYCHPRPAMRITGKTPGLAGGVVDAKDAEAKTPADKGARHSSDIEYAMGNLPTNRVYDWQPDDYTMSTIFQSYYLNFVKTGNPNGLGLPDWTPTNGQDVAPVLHLDVNTYMTVDKDREDVYKKVDALLWNK